MGILIDTVFGVVSFTIYMKLGDIKNKLKIKVIQKLNVCLNIFRRNRFNYNNINLNNLDS